MDGREGMPPFYLNRGLSGSGSHGGGGFHVPPPGFKTQTNPNLSPLGHSNLRATSSIGSSFQIEHNPSPNFPHGIHIGGGGGGGDGSGGGGGGGPMATPGSGSESIVKKKRGRPRKSTPDESHMALGLTSGVSSAASPDSITPTPKKNRGRPPGSGRKQRLANVGEWMHNSAGFAFTPHVIHILAGEDVAAKILSFAQQRPRALCVLSGNGAVSAVTLRQFTSSGASVTYEGHFDILCLSGSYLLAETGGHNRTGGLSISVCSADGHVIGGPIGGRLLASSLVQVVVCSFVYDGYDSKAKTKIEAPLKDEKSSGVQLN